MGTEARSAPVPGNARHRLSSASRSLRPARSPLLPPETELLACPAASSAAQAPAERPRLSTATCRGCPLPVSPPAPVSPRSLPGPPPLTPAQRGGSTAARAGDVRALSASAPQWAGGAARGWSRCPAGSRHRRSSPGTAGLGTRCRERGTLSPQRVSRPVTITRGSPAGAQSPPHRAGERGSPAHPLPPLRLPRLCLRPLSVPSVPGAGPLLPPGPCALAPTSSLAQGTPAPRSPGMPLHSSRAPPHARSPSTPPSPTSSRTMHPGPPGFPTSPVPLHIPPLPSPCLLLLLLLSGLNTPCTPQTCLPSAARTALPCPAQLCLPGSARSGSPDR